MARGRDGAAVGLPWVSYGYAVGAPWVLIGSAAGAPWVRGYAIICMLWVCRGSAMGPTWVPCRWRAMIWICYAYALGMLCLRGRRHEYAWVCYYSVCPTHATGTPPWGYVQCYTPILQYAMGMVRACGGLSNVGGGHDAGLGACEEEGYVYGRRRRRRTAGKIKRR